MTQDDADDVTRAAGLPGWKAHVRYAQGVGRYVAVITSPDYNPVRRTGIIKAATGRDIPDAFARALEAVRGCVQPAPSVH